MYGKIKKTCRARVDCSESNFVSLVEFEFPACSPKLSSNGIRLSEFLKVDCGVLHCARGIQVQILDYRRFHEGVVPGPVWLTGQDKIVIFTIQSV